MLGVASGDPLPTGGVLWTRIAPRPMEVDWGMDGVRARVALAAIGDRQIVEYVSRAGAPKITASSWRCEHARAGVMKV